MADIDLVSGSSKIKGVGGPAGDMFVSELMGRYYNLVRKGQVYTAYATVTAPVIYSTAAGTGGPLIWNGSSSVDVVVLGMGYSVSVVTTVAGSIGLTGGRGQATAPSSTTAIDAGPQNLMVGGPLPLSTSYRVGTVANAGNFFIPIAFMHTGALTVDTNALSFVDLGGMIVVPPQSWVSVAGSATLTTLQVAVALVYAEVPK